jgi:hypothetical protein
LGPALLTHPLSLSNGSEGGSGAAMLLRLEPIQQLPAPSLVIPAQARRCRGLHLTSGGLPPAGSSPSAPIPSGRAEGRSCPAIGHPYSTHVQLSVVPPPPPAGGWGRCRWGGVPSQPSPPPFSSRRRHTPTSRGGYGASASPIQGEEAIVRVAALVMGQPRRSAPTEVRRHLCQRHYHDTLLAGGR